MADIPVTSLGPQSRSSLLCRPRRNLPRLELRLQRSPRPFPGFKRLFGSQVHSPLVLTVLILTLTSLNPTPQWRHLRKLGRLSLLPHLGLALGSGRYPRYQSPRLRMRLNNGCYNVERVSNFVLINSPGIRCRRGMGTTAGLQLMSEPKARTKISSFGMFSKNCKYLSQFCADLHKTWTDILSRFMHN
jgi:hypothetical protein